MTANPDQRAVQAMIDMPQDDFLRMCFLALPDDVQKKLALKVAAMWEMLGERAVREEWV